MSKRQALLVLLVFFPVGWWLSDVIDRLFVKREIVGEARVGNIGRAQGRLLFVLDDSRWTVFKLSSRHGHVKIVTNAACQRSESLLTRVDIPYSIEYFAVDADGEATEVKEYWFRSRVKQVKLHGGEEMMLGGFFLDRNVVPTAGRIAVLDLSETPSEAVELHVRMGARDSGVVDVGCRVFCEEILPEAKRAVRWERMSRDARERVERTSVYSLDLLTDEEKSRIAGRQWAAIGPIGVKGEDYTARRLYVVRQREGEVVATEIERQGVWVDADLDATMTVPEGGARVRLDVTPTVVASRREPIALELSWWGRRASEDGRFETSIAPSGGAVVRQLPGGTLRVRCVERVLVHWSIWSDGRWENVENEPARGRTYVLDRDDAIRYALRYGPQPKSATASRRVGMRWRLRILVDSTEVSGHGEELDAAVEYELVDAEGQVVGQGSFELRERRSRQDFAAGVSGRTGISKPVDRYLAVPENAVEARLWSARGAVVVAATTGLPADEVVTRVPDDHYRPHPGDLGSRWWLPVWPANRHELFETGRSLLVLTQRAPTERDPRIVSGDYRVLQVEAVGDAVGRYLLVPRAQELGAGEPTGREFVELPTNRVVDVEVFAREPERPPRVVLVRQGGSDAVIVGRLIVDGEVASQLRLRGDSAAVTIGTIAPGAHAVEIDMDGSARVFLEGAIVSEAPVWRRRFATRTRDGVVAYRYRKSSAEPVSLLAKVFLPAAADGMCSVCVRIRGPEPECDGLMTGWTFLRRRYELRADAAPTVLVTGDSGCLLREARRFAIPLSSDLPAGEYEIELRLEDSAEAYALLQEVVLGAAESTAVALESGTTK